jgi:hypothetical protein
LGLGVLGVTPGDGVEDEVLLVRWSYIQFGRRRGYLVSEIIDITSWSLKLLRAIEMG